MDEADFQRFVAPRPASASKAASRGLRNQPSCGAYDAFDRQVHHVADRLGEIWIQGSDLVQAPGASEDPAPWPPRGVKPLVRGTEEPEGGCAGRRGKVHEAGVVADEEPGVAQGGVKGDEVHLSDKVDEPAAGRHGAEGGQNARILGTARHHQASAFQGTASAEKLDRDLGEALDRPGLADPVRGGAHCEDGPLAGHQPRRLPRRGLADINVGGGWIFLQAKDPRRFDHLVDRDARASPVDRPLPAVQQAADRRPPEVDDKTPRPPAHLVPEPDPVAAVPGFLEPDDLLKAGDVLEQGRGGWPGDNGEPRAGNLFGKSPDESGRQYRVTDPGGGDEENRKGRGRHCGYIIGG